MAAKKTTPARAEHPDDPGNAKQASAKPKKTAKPATTAAAAVAPRGQTASGEIGAQTPTKKTKEGTKKLSALDAAAKVLGERREPLNCQEMIAIMAAEGYWSSPAGKTPAATLYAAIMRETKAKGKDARFRKTARGKFERNAT
jgi:hypothetical protein